MGKLSQTLALKILKKAGKINFLIIDKFYTNISKAIPKEFTNQKNYEKSTSKTGQYDLRKAQIDFARKEQHRLKEIYGIDFNFDESQINHIKV